MEFHSHKKHFIDILFLIVLLCLFLISSILLLIMGTHIYQNTIEQMNINYNTRTAYAYLTEKCQQLDTYNSASLEAFGDGDAIVLTQDIDGTSYQTRLYLYKNELRELFSKTDVSLSPAAGQIILACSELNISQIKDDLYHIQVITSDGTNLSLYINLHAGGYNS